MYWTYNSYVLKLSIINFPYISTLSSKTTGYVYKKHCPLLLWYKKPALNEKVATTYGEKRPSYFLIFIMIVEMQGTYDEEELKRIILGAWAAPDFRTEYNSLESPPMIRNVEEINEGDIAHTLVRASQRVSELRRVWFRTEMSPTYTSSIRLIYYRPQTIEEYVNEKMSQWRWRSSSANYKHYLFTTLWLRHESTIRAIYVKLLLEHKITLEDFTDLVQAKDMDIDLVGLCGWAQIKNNTYFI